MGFRIRASMNIAVCASGGSEHNDSSLIRITAHILTRQRRPPHDSHQRPSWDDINE